MELQQLIETAWENRELLKEAQYEQAVHDTIEEIDKGRLRVAEPTNDGWKVNDWIKKAVILYFPTRNINHENAM